MLELVFCKADLSSNHKRRRVWTLCNGQKTETQSVREMWPWYIRTEGYQAGYMGKFIRRWMLLSPPFVIAPVNRCQLWLADLGGETGYPLRDLALFPLLSGAVHVLHSGISRGKGWLCLPEAPCSEAVGLVLQAGLFRSVEKGKKSVQTYSSKEHCGSEEQGVVLSSHTDLSKKAVTDLAVSDITLSLTGVWVFCF